MLDYADMIMGATRGYKYCVTGEHEAWIYREGDTYAMGKITYADVTDSGLSQHVQCDIAEHSEQQIFTWLAAALGIVGQPEYSGEECVDTCVL